MALLVSCPGSLLQHYLRSILVLRGSQSSDVITLLPCSKVLRPPLPTDENLNLLPGIQGSFTIPTPLSTLTNQNLILLFLKHALTLPSSRTAFISRTLFLLYPSPYSSLPPLAGTFPLLWVTMAPLAPSHPLLITSYHCSVP